MISREVNIPGKKIPALEAKGVSFSYTDASPVFRDISFSLFPGDILTLLGPNGSGKSTLLDCLCGLLTIDEGIISIDGEDYSSLSRTEIARRVGYVPQTHAPDFDFPVRDYVVMGRAPYLNLLKVPGRREYEITDTALETLGITRLGDKLYSKISGGERQQVQIARVLVQEPEIIMLDEPTSHLDYGNQIKILKLVTALSDRGITVIMTTHMPDHPILLEGMVGILDGKGGMKMGKAGEVVNERDLMNMYRVDLRLVYIKELDRVACVAGKLKG